MPNGSWEGRYSYVDLEGIRRQPQVTGKTWSEAKGQLKEMIDRIEAEKQAAEQPGHVEPNKILFGEWLDVWLDEILPKPGN